MLVKGKIIDFSTVNGAFLFSIVITDFCLAWKRNQHFFALFNFLKIIDFFPPRLAAQPQHGSEWRLNVIQLDAHLTCWAVYLQRTRRLSGHFSCTRTARKNLSASVNELSDERLSGFSNISTTLRCASSFNPSSPGWRDYFKMWTLRLRLCHQSAPRSSQVMQYSVHHSLHYSNWV